jgi:hypothetical protein
MQIGLGSGGGQHLVDALQDLRGAGRSLRDNSGRAILGGAGPLALAGGTPNDLLLGHGTSSSTRSGPVD